MQKNCLLFLPHPKFDPFSAKKKETSIKCIYCLIVKFQKCHACPRHHQSNDFLNEKYIERKNVEHIWFTKRISWITSIFQASNKLHAYIILHLYPSMCA